MSEVRENLELELDDVIIKDMPTYYANYAVVNMSTYDLIINFFMRISDATQEQAKVVMSPQYAKSLIELLNSALKDYEDTFGEINIEPNTQEHME